MHIPYISILILQPKNQYQSQMAKQLMENSKHMAINETKNNICRKSACKHDHQVRVKVRVLEQMRESPYCMTIRLRFGLGCWEPLTRVILLLCTQETDGIVDLLHSNCNSQCTMSWVIRQYASWTEYTERFSCKAIYCIHLTRSEY